MNYHEEVFSIFEQSLGMDKAGFEVKVKAIIGPKTVTLKVGENHKMIFGRRHYFENFTKFINDLSKFMSDEGL